MVPTGDTGGSVYSEPGSCSGTRGSALYVFFACLQHFISSCIQMLLHRKILPRTKGMRSSRKKPLQDVGSGSPYLRNGKLAQIHFLASWQARSKEPKARGLLLLLQDLAYLILKPWSFV